MDHVHGCSEVHGSAGPQAGPTWARYWGDGGALTCELGYVNTPGEQAFSEWYWGMKSCGTGSYPGCRWKLEGSYLRLHHSSWVNWAKM